MEARTATVAFKGKAAAERIHWPQLASLAALYASVIIGWIAYKNYQPKLLDQFKFTELTSLLIFAQGVILVVTPMVAGRLGDRYRISNGHRLPVISAGISFAAMIFMAVAFTLVSEPGDVLKWILPVLIILWLVSMSIFTSPALSTMELFTPVDKLPYAMAILTITGNLLYALEPVIVDIIDLAGAPLTFMVGGTVVLLSGYALKRNSLDLFKITAGRERHIAEAGKTPSPYGFIFFTGLSVGMATAILFFLIPKVAENGTIAFSGIGVTWLIVIMLLLSALVSWPIGTLVNRHGIVRSFWFSMACLFLSAGAICFVNGGLISILMLTVFSLAYTSLSVTGLPMAIKSALHSEKVFCVGIFFSGAALPEAVYGMIGVWTV